MRRSLSWVWAFAPLALGVPTGPCLAYAAYRRRSSALGGAAAVATAAAVVGLALSGSANPHTSDIGGFILVSLMLIGLVACLMLRTKVFEFTPVVAGGDRIFHRRVRWFEVGLVAPAILVLLALTVPNGPALDALGSVGSLLLIGLAIQVARLKIVIGDDEVQIHNLYRTHRVRVGEIASVEAAPDAGAFRHTGIRVHLRDGRLVCATAFGRGQLDSNSMGNEVLQALRDKIAAVPSTV